MAKESSGEIRLKITPILVVLSVMLIVRMALVPDNPSPWVAYGFALLASMGLYWVVKHTWTKIQRGRIWLLMCGSMTLVTSLIGLLLDQTFLGVVVGFGVSVVLSSLVLGMLRDQPGVSRFMSLDEGEGA